MKINPKKIIKKSEKIADFPEAVRYKKDKFKYYWAHFRWPSLKQWKELPKILTKKEKLSFIAFLMIFLISASYLSYSLYLAKTDIVPTKGGEYKEGIVGNPRFINPIYSDFSDVDRDTVELIFSGLTRYTPEGKIVPDMADNIKTEEEGKKVTVTLKEGLFWADGQEITTDDVVFTIEKIQDPDYKSSLRTNWLGVKAEKISDKVVSFTLKKPFGAFKERLTLKIIPKHIWEDISPENFPLSLFNLKPVGSGPYKIKELEQNNEGFIKSLSLERNELYHGQEPYISNIDLLFFESEEEILKAWKNRVIDGFSLTSLEKVSDLNYNFLSNQENFNIYYFSLPRYFSVFFNLGVKNNSEILKEEKIREAINYGTDKEQILNSIAEGKGVTVDSPILPKIFGFNEPQTKYEFNLEKAKQILEDAGFKETERGTREREIKESAPFEFKSTLQVGSEGQEVRKLQECLSDEKLVDPSIYPSKKVTGYFGQETKQAVINFQEEYYQDILKPWGFESGTGIVYRTTREKLNEVCFQPEQKFTPLKFTLKTAENELLIKVANILKDQWQKFGLELEIEIYPISQFENEVIKTRDYQMLLFGESLGIIPDPYPFWHSSQEKNPGLNLIGYEDKEADELLEEARGTLDPKERAQKLQTFQEIIIKDAPCVFLFSPDYLHFISKSIKGISQKVVADPSKRFIDVESWYIKTKRALPKE